MRLVWYDCPGRGTLKTFSASSSTNKLLFIFDIIVLVYHRYQLSDPTDCSVFHWYWCESRTANGSRSRFSQRSEKHYARIRVRWNGDDLGDIGNAEINLEEARLAKRNVFAHIAVRHTWGSDCFLDHWKLRYRIMMLIAHVISLSVIIFYSIF